LGIGPFARYYMLDPRSKINIVTDARIAFYGTSTNLSGHRQKYRAYSAATGPVLFLNQSIGIELLMGYSGSKDDATTRNGFRTSLGVQAHWGRR
jgi:hypothetical protein